jgi:hypothetical protein
VLNPSTPSPNFVELKYTDFMDVPDQAIEELRGIGRDLIPDVPDWLGEDTEPANLDASTKAANVEAFVGDQDSEDPSAKEPWPIFFFFFLTRHFVASAVFFL